MIAPFALPFNFPDFCGRKVLILGLGGGCDIITAFALAKMLDSEQSEDLYYANTKSSDFGSVEPITPHIMRVAGPTMDTSRRLRGRGKAWIERSVPRHPNGSPLIFVLNDERAESDLVGEIQSLKFDLLVGVDTGGDSIVEDNKGFGRDRRMLEVVRQTGLPLLHIVVAPGSDGQSSYEKLHEAFVEKASAGRFLGSFSLEPMLPIFSAFRGALSPTRTACIILSVAEGRLPSDKAGRIEVPRGCKPRMPKEWLMSGFAFAPEPTSPSWSDIGGGGKSNRKVVEDTDANRAEGVRT